jgi:5-oxoprolinase (ATP-hydrolysing)
MMIHPPIDEETVSPSGIQAWIDVGGTFTDCIVRLRCGVTLRGKTLSTGRVPVSVERSPNGDCLCTELAGDADRFWIGASLVGFCSQGRIAFEREIIDFRQGGRMSLFQQSSIPWDEVVRFEISPGCEAPVLAVRRLLQIPLTQALPGLSVRLGTTRGTNALLTGSGARIALIVTNPFDDLLAIGDQSRPDLFSLDIRKPRQLAAVTLSISERLSARGEVLVPLDLEDSRRKLEFARQSGCQSLAISLLHGYRNPSHELALAELASQMGFQQVSLSSRVAPAIEYVARTQTTVVDAYLSPVIREYLTCIVDQFGGPQRVNLDVMTSAGGLVDWRSFSGKDSILSGPAGGVIALRSLRNALGLAPMVGLDMGGTSTDVCGVDREVELQYESRKAGVRILTPTLPIETVASGGGSICWFDGVSLRVGPDSAGAKPGPACYGRGGPLTLTDLNVFSGRIPERQFPFPLDLDATQSRINAVLEQIAPVLGRWTAGQLVDAFRALACEQMADAVRSVSIKQGIDPRSHILVGFGGAAGQHICEIAESLDIDRILDHPDAGLLSALGMGVAQASLNGSLAVYEPLSKIQWSIWLPRIDQKLAELVDELSRRLGDAAPLAQGVSAELRYLGAEASLTVPLEREEVVPDSASGSGRQSAQSSELQMAQKLEDQFSSLHRRRFGYCRATSELELVSIRVNVETVQANALPDMHRVSAETALTPAKASPSGFPGEYVCYSREELAAGARFDGPALIMNAGSTLTVEKGWSAEVFSDGSLLLHRRRAGLQSGLENGQSAPSTQTQIGTGGKAEMDPVFRDCYAQRLASIAVQMGTVLQQTAISVNIKQRRDFSCAVFDGNGNLLANAPHVPVHLGAMGQTVRSVIEKYPDVRSGDCFISNDPYEGGSHLPDLTVVVPVFGLDDQRPGLWVANRAHHADIGGLAPGSMSVVANRLEEEGVIIAPFRWIRCSQIREDELQRLIRQSKYPPRNWRENLADLNAQHAACLRGVELLGDYANSVGWEEIQTYAGHLLNAAEMRIRHFVREELQRLTGFPVGVRYKFQDCLEDGTPIKACVTPLEDGGLLIDFSGTGPVSTSNFNANASIVTAAVLYVLRCLISDELPLNEGVLRAVQIRLPECVLNPPVATPRGDSPAVAAGNVETSQRVVDVLLGAFGVAAASQGTMNNVLFGTRSFGFYETIGGGAGATTSADGASAVHTHMTNTRLTDPEVIELRYPVRLLDFRIRTNSGGRGRHHGGDGIVRTFEFVEAVTLSLISSRRNSAPFGLKGGQPGAKGENWLETPDGKRLPLPASCQIDVPAGTRLTIQTPGGGGFGPAE